MAKTSMVDGYYWLNRAGVEPVIVRVYNELAAIAPDAEPRFRVQFFGTDHECEIHECPGVYAGPIREGRMISGLRALAVGQEPPANPPECETSYLIRSKEDQAAIEALFEQRSS